MRRDYLICLGLLVINLIGFWPVGRLGFINYDDPVYVSENPNIQAGITPESVDWAFATMYAGNWHPVTWLSHMLDCQLFGLNPAGHHWMNLGLHIANTLLLFIVLRETTKKAWCSALVAALFAAHPMHVQSVAWISERKDVLSGFFFLLTLLAYARYAQGVTSGGWRVTRNDGQNASRVTRHTSRFYWLAVFFFALGLMSKPMLVTLPFVLLLLDFWPLRRISELGVRSSELKNTSRPSALNSDESRAGSDQSRAGSDQSRAGSDQSRAGSQLLTLLFEKWPFVVLSLISCLATLRAQGDAGFVIHVTPLPWYVRVIITPVFYTAYLGKIFWPENLAVFYPYPLVQQWQIACAGLLLILLSVFCLRQARSRAYLLVGWFWFLVTLVPVIGLVQVGTQSIADRYMYLPSIGLFMAVAWGLGELAARSRLWRTGMTLAATAAVAACLLDTRYQLRYWRDSITLFNRALEVTRENNSMSYYVVGLALWKSGDLDGAVRNYRAALKITPGFVEASSRLGYILLQQNKPAEAEVEFKGVLRWDPSDTKAHKYLGDALAAQGKVAEAEAEYATVLQLNPGNAVISEALQPEFEKLKTAKALANLYEALKLQPTPEAHARIAVIRTSQGEFQDAVEHYQAALQLKPDAPDLLNNLAWLLATCPDDRIRNGAQAVQYAERACELTQHRQAMMLGTLAAAYAEAGRFDDAVTMAEKTCELATQQGETILLQKNQALLELYREHKPWRE